MCLYLVVLCFATHWYKISSILFLDHYCQLIDCLLFIPTDRMSSLFVSLPCKNVFAFYSNMWCLFMLFNCFCQVLNTWAFFVLFTDSFNQFSIYFRMFIKSCIKIKFLDFQKLCFKNKWFIFHLPLLANKYEDNR